MKRLVPFILILLLIIGGAASAQDDAVLQYGISNNVDTLDPNVTTFSSVGVIMGHVFDPLVRQEPLGTFHPGLATEWSVNDDATEYTFTLREGVTFHDGTPFNAEAVKFTFDRIADPATNSQLGVSLLGPYAETEVVSETEIVVRFEQPFAPFLDSASTPYLGIASPTAISEMGEAYGQEMVVGTGPFAVESYVPESEVALVRNDDYAWGSEAVFGMSGPSALAGITFRIVQEPATRLAALESGEVSFIDDVPELDVERLTGSEEITIQQIEQPGHGWSLMMNVENAPTDELAVRQAIALASDKQSMIDIVFNGFGTPGCSPVTKVMFGYDAAACDYLPYNPEMAMQVLEDAGWVDEDGDGIRERDGETLTIQHWFRADGEPGASMAQFMQADLAAVGIEVVLNGASRSGYFDAVRAGEHNTQNWWDTQTDPDGVMRTLYYSANADGGTNRNRYRSEELDGLIDAAAGTADAAEREALYAEIQQFVADNAIMVFFNDPFLLYGYDSNLSGVLFLGGGTLPNLYAASFGM